MASASCTRLRADTTTSSAALAAAWLLLLLLLLPLLLPLPTASLAPAAAASRLPNPSLNKRAGLHSQKQDSPQLPGSMQRQHKPS
jgi:hypothetical protein